MNCIHLFFARSFGKTCCLVLGSEDLTPTKFCITQQGPKVFWHILNVSHSCEQKKVRFSALPPVPATFFCASSEIAVSGFCPGSFSESKTTVDEMKLGCPFLKNYFVLGGFSMVSSPSQKISRASSYGVDKVTMFEAFFPKFYFVCKEKRWNETQNSGRPVEVVH